MEMKYTQRQQHFICPASLEAESPREYEAREKTVKKNYILAISTLGQARGVPERMTAFTDAHWRAIRCQ